MSAKRSPRNRTLALTADDRSRLAPALAMAPTQLAAGVHDLVLHGDCMTALTALAPGSVRLLFLDPPYNMAKQFGGRRFSKRSAADYEAWFEEALVALLPLLTADATVYICSEWRTSGPVQTVAERHLKVRNRITWEREKGRGAQHNWKNASEDIWFCTVGGDYCFDVDAVKQRRPVIAPYRDAAGRPKDWQDSAAGRYRDTHPSNFWTDITVPFWSMPENTDHPTQKSEKLVAKLLLASSASGDLVLDPFLGSGTTAVVARKLGRSFIGVEADEDYCLLALRRLELAASQPDIQGYADGAFWPRNSSRQQRRNAPR
jgi:site-specific DNA-methyltransferase (adenine-specific)